ncbi:hypothetical protein FD39_GL000184 [Lactobacillus amylolyticus DSM 11664]|nr:hypothetical protein FD39_GL000184 [Lactobacillus amylolyticus DSM 11664]
MEGFFGILKREMFYGKETNYANLDELEQAIKDHIRFYNTERTKIKLKGLTPEQFRNQSLVDHIRFYNTERTKTKLKGLTPEQFRNQSLAA